MLYNKLVKAVSTVMRSPKNVMCVPVWAKARLTALILILAVGSGALLTAADKKKKSKKKDDAIAAAAAATAPTPPGAAQPEMGGKVDPNAYVIGAEDVLFIRVWRDQELSGQVVVRPDGKVTLQLLGEVQAAGMTPASLTKVIRDGLAEKYLNKPEVTISVLQVNSKKFYLQGELNRPGPYPLLVPTTILEALVNAGGFRDFANQKKIFVMRGGQRYYFNYKDVIKGKNMDQNIQLQNGDIIVVP